MTCRLHNDGFNSSVIDATFDLYNSIFDIRADVAIFLAENDYDESYKREFFRASLNVGKVLKGFRGNLLTKSFIESILSALKFDLEFPFKKGIYELKNWTLPGQHLPAPMKARFLADVKYVVKTSLKSKKWLFGTLFKNYGKLT